LVARARGTRATIPSAIGVHSVSGHILVSSLP